MVNIKSIEKVFNHLLFFALFFLCLGIFTSITLTSLFHIFSILAGLWIIYYRIKNRDEDWRGMDHLLWERIKMSKSYFALLLLTIISILSIFFNLDKIDNPIKQLLQTKYLFLTLLIVFPFWYGKLIYFDRVSSIMRGKKVYKIEFLLYLFLFATTLASAIGIYSMYTGYNPLRMKLACHPTRNCGLYGMYMTYAYGMQFFILLLGGFWYNRKRIKEWFIKDVGDQKALKKLEKSILFKSWFLIPLFFFNLTSFFLSEARGAIIGFVISFPFLFLSRKNIKKIIVFLATLLLAAFTLYQSSEIIQNRFDNFERNKSTDVRFSQYTAAFYAFKESPLFGVGFRNFEPLSKVIKEKYALPHQDFMGHAHNNFLEHLASTGILGLIALLLFHLLWGYEMFKDRSLVGRITFPVIIALFISGQFQYSFGDGENMFLLTGLYIWSLIGHELPLKKVLNV